MNAAWHICNGRVVDPLTHTDAVRDLYLLDGRIAPAPAAPPPSLRVIDATGLVVVPAFIDLHVHLREPGNEEAETIETGCRAAARGGFGTIVAMPNTTPPLDTAERVAWVAARGEVGGLARVLPAGCLTAGRRGERVADLQGMAAAGAVAFTDDGSAVAEEAVMAAAMVAARAAGRPVLDHALDPALAEGGVMHAGEPAARWGLPGIPSEAESRIVARDIRLCEQTGCAVHIQHVSARESVALIRAARQRGLPVSGEATPHHLALCDTDIDPTDADFKMSPPLRGAADRAAIHAAVADGTLQALATDHAPHTRAAKQHGFRLAPFGVIGLETAVGITYTELVAGGAMSLPEWIERWTQGPASVLGLAAPCLREGRRADVTVLDLDTEWIVDPQTFLSRSRNTPFGGRRCRGRAVCTFRDGRLVWQGGS